jgi:voltage-gated potassium channel
MTEKEKWHTIVFGTETKAGKRFDVILLWTILFSVLVVMVDSIPYYHSEYFKFFFIVEWVLTAVFTIEYLLRIWISPKRLNYIFSFWGVIDLLSILPSYLSLILVGAQYLLIIRIFRLLRVFRILKLARFISEARVLTTAIQASLHKISLFFILVLTVVTFLGAIMYVVEPAESGFTSIPQGIYWAIVTVTTVGFGDVVPSTILGKFISSFAMLIGYSIIAIPTGIVTVGLAQATSKGKKCGSCSHQNPLDSHYCNNCGKPFEL